MKPWRMAGGVAVLLVLRLGRLTAQDRPAASSLAFAHVTVIDVTDGRLLPEQTVVLAGQRIQVVGPAATTPIPQRAQVVDARGKYLLPGFWDMHVHVLEYPDIFYPFFIANGVTGVREMHQSAFPLDSLLQWRREITTGARVGPRIVGTGGFLESESTDLAPLAIVVTTPDEARHAVDSLQAAGADFVKIRGGLPREIFFAIAAEARRIGLPLAGHLSDSVTVAEAADSGQRSIEHFNYPDLEQSCSSDVDTAERCAALVARMQRNDTWFVPTLSALYYGWSACSVARPPSRAPARRSSPRGSRSCG
jgi:imidazolonepropionase-like amidohydrolase